MLDYILGVYLLLTSAAVNCNVEAIVDNIDWRNGRLFLNVLQMIQIHLIDISNSTLCRGLVDSGLLGILECYTWWNFVRALNADHRLSKVGLGLEMEVTLRRINSWLRNELTGDVCKRIMFLFKLIVAVKGFF